MQNSNISFTSRIRLVSKADFISYKKDKKLLNGVAYPWTVNETLRARKVYTDGVYDCSAGGVTSRDDVTMFHLCPMGKTLNNWASVVKGLKQRIPLNDTKLRALLIGSHNYRESNKVFNRLQQFMEKSLIPYSMFKANKKLEDGVDILFNAEADEWLISHPMVTEEIYSSTRSIKKKPKEARSKILEAIMNKAFMQVKIAEGDFLDL